MCFSGPKPPAVVADPELERQKADAAANAQADRASNKQAMIDQMIAGIIGKGGRNSLFTKSGGSGFAAPQARSLFTVQG